MQSSSKYLQNAVDALSSLPGIGRKTAMRLALNLLGRSEEEVADFSKAIAEMKENIQFCQKCHNLSDGELCPICSSPKREQQVVCVVEDIRDILAIEATHQYFGLYHVLGGVISPMDGVGPSDLEIEDLLERLKKEEINEVVLALSTTLEGDTTAYYLSKCLSEFDLKLTTIARGVSVGDNLEYADEITLGKSIVHRVPYESSMSNQN
jgi:recombination protein RecR